MNLLRILHPFVRWRPARVAATRPAAAARVLEALLVVALSSATAAATEWAAVGRVNIAGQSFCTGTLIRPDRALTAAHCLFHPRTGRLANLSDIHFVAGWDRGAFVAHAQPKTVHIAIGYDWAQRQALAGLEHDVAILEFAEPVAAPTLAMLEPAAASDDLAVVHYSRLRPHLALVDVGCTRQRDLGRLWLLDCPVEPGGSGAPVLTGAPKTPQIAAIVVGRTQIDGAWVTLALPMGAADVPLRP